MSNISPPPESAVPSVPTADAHEIRHEQRRYLAVYAVLVVGTVLTVAMYYIHFEALWQTVGVALLIAATKATFVAAIFMHLWHGQRDIYRMLFFTAVFAVGMFVLTTYAHFRLPGVGHYVR
jgi:caa(3)-type oxidase subunit IV